VADGLGGGKQDPSCRDSHRNDSHHRSRRAPARRPGLVHPRWARRGLSTSSASAKARNLQRDQRVALCVDDDAPPFGFVTIKGQAQVIPRPDDFLAWTTRIARRYLGPERAVEMGTRNIEMDDTLVRIRFDSYIAYADIVP